jgi:phosphomevalonate kinase
MISPAAIAMNLITNSKNAGAKANEVIFDDLKQQIRLLDAAIAPLRGKAKKKLAKIEDELNCNFLINTGLGSKDDKAALRKTKRQLRERRIKLWEELKVLPSLEEERHEAVRQLNALRRRHGILDVSS